VRAMTRPTARVGDALLAAAGLAGLISEGLARDPGGLSAVDYVLALATASTMLWRTRAPLRTLAAAEVGALACAAVFDANLAATGLIMIALYTVARFGDRRRSIIVGAITAVVVIAAVATLDEAFNLAAMALRVPLVVVALAVGELVRSRGALRTLAREREALAVREREEEARRRLSDERLRIARELHDTLAHSLVAMNVRAGVALDLRGTQDPYAALSDVKQASANALRDLRATLRLLRDETDAAPTAPALGLEALEDLVEHVRAAGLKTEFDLRLEHTTVPTPVAGTAFRIVQESLTNVLRHADATAALVSVRARGDALQIEIADNGRASPSAAATTGLGLRGMAERAHAVGGTIDSGPRHAGGWRVTAALPLRLDTTS
jgi:signal transduction histidine kinase